MIMPTSLATTILLLLLPPAIAFAPSPFARTTTSLAASRADFLRAAGVLSTGLVFPALAEETVTLPSGVSYVVKKSGSTEKPQKGELVGIRFKAVVAGKNNVIDDTFDTPEPYYTRVGSGGLVKVSDPP